MDFILSVLKRLLALISNTAQLIAENKAIKQQAESANRAAKSLLDASAPPAPGDEKRERKKSESSEKSSSAELERQLLSKSEELEQIRKSYQSAKVDLETMKKQAKSVTEEYDNLLKEHAKVLARLERFESGDGPVGSEAKKQN
jgi:chromosome segregation ATPase